MTGRRDRRLFGLAMAVASAVLALGWTAAWQPAAAADSHCDISGTVAGNNPARVGDALETRAFIGGATCRARAMQFDGGGQSWGYQAVFSGQTEYDAVVNAFPGLSSISVVLSDGQRAVIGTVTVVSDQTTPPVRTTAPLPPPPTPTPSTVQRATPTVTTVVSSAAPPSTSLPKSKITSASSATAHRAPVVVLPAFGGGSDGESADSSSAPPTSPHSDGADVAFKVAVIHGDGSVHAIPAALLIATIVVFGGIVGAAVRLVYLNARRAD